MMSTGAGNWTRTEKCFLALAACIVAFACGMQFYAAAGGDQAWLLLAARMWLAGGRLYVDIFEVNPPLILCLYAVPVFIAQHLPVFSDAHVLVLLGFCAIASCLWLSDRLIALHPQATQRRRVLFALLLAILFVPFINPLHFCDREHIFTVLVFPYLLRFMPSLAERKLPSWLSVVIGVMAAVGFCIKPHCAIVFIGVQLMVLLRERRISALINIPNLIIGVFFLLYVTSVWLLLPEYFSIVLPMALATYGGFNQKGDWIFYAAVSFLIVAVTFIDFRPRYKTPYRRDIYYFMALTPFFYAYAWLNNGWAYTYVPFNTILMLLTALVLTEQLYLYREQGVRNALQGVRACALVLVTNVMLTLTIYVLALYVTFDGKDHESARNEGLAALVRNSHADTFGVISADFGMWPPLVAATDTRLVTRFNHLWMLPRFIASGEDFTRSHAWILAYVAHAFSHDLRNHRPDVVLVDMSPSFFMTNRQVNVPAMLSAYPDFKEEWGHYRLSDSMNTCRPPAKKYLPRSCRFDLYRRQP